MKGWLVYENQCHWTGMLFTRPRFRHVWMLLMPEPGIYMAVEKQGDFLELGHYRHFALENFHLTRGVVLQEVDLPLTPKKRGFRMPLPFTCVEIIKVALDLPWWIITPYQLFNHIASRETKREH